MSVQGGGEKRSYAIALLRSLKFAKVKFLTYTALDVCGNIRCKAVPVSHLLNQLLQEHDSNGDNDGLDYRVSIAKACFTGLPSYGDVVVAGSGVDARDVCLVQPDLSTLRILPYAPHTAVVLGTLQEVLQQRPPTTSLPMSSNNNISDVCCRGLLQQVVQQAAVEFQLGVNVGAELEFVLLDAETNEPLDGSNFADSVTLVRHEPFLVELADRLEQQEIPIELLHAESAHSQLEVVIRYQNDPVRLADLVYFTKETIRHVAHQHKLKALFLPKFSATQAGNGCHVHLSLYDRISGRNVFPVTDDATINTDDDRSLLSTRGQSFLEGILHHLPALLAFSMPMINSFRRVGVGCWTGSTVSWAVEDKESSVRVARNYQQGWRCEHFEVKVCDSVGNLHLTLAAMILAGLDGIRQQRELRLSRNHASQPAQEPLPATLEEALTALEENDVLRQSLPVPIRKGYLAVRRADINYGKDKSLEEEVTEALKKA